MSDNMTLCIDYKINDDSIPAISKENIITNMDMLSSISPGLSIRHNEYGKDLYVVLVNADDNSALIGAARYIIDNIGIPYRVHSGYDIFDDVLKSYNMKTSMSIATLIGCGRTISKSS